MQSVMTSLALAAGLALLLVAARLLLTPAPEAAVIGPLLTGATGSAGSQLAPGRAHGATPGASADEPTPGGASGATRRDEAEARLARIEARLFAMEDEVAGLDAMSEAEAEALYERAEPLLEELAAAELALEAIIQEENAGAGKRF